MKQKPAQRDLEKELGKARMIQEMLLPQAFPTIPGAHLAFRYVPVYDIGGDFLDYFYKRATAELGFVICDVSGHGIPAALISAMLKMSLQLWGEYIDDPSGTLEKMRRMLMGKLGDDFVTVGLGYLNLQNGRLRYVNAGHTPMLLLKKSGATQFIKPAGRILHERVEQRCDLFETVLEAGDRLALYTDGVSEAVDPNGRMLGDEGAAELLHRHWAPTPEQTCEAAFADLVSFVGGREHLRDDSTLFLLEYSGPCEADQPI